MKKTSLRGKSFFVASKSAGRERLMRDPDWTAVLVRDVHGARGVGVSMYVSLLLFLKFSGRIFLLHLDCSRSHVPQKYYFSYHLQCMSSEKSSPSFSLEGYFFLPLSPRSFGAPRFDQSCPFPSKVCSITIDTRLRRKSQTPKQLGWIFFRSFRQCTWRLQQSRRYRDQAGNANAQYHSNASALHEAKPQMFEA